MTSAQIKEMRRLLNKARRERGFALCRLEDAVRAALAFMSGKPRLLEKLAGE
jgi:hypothetical protein